MPFRVIETRIGGNQLISAGVEVLPPDPLGGEVDALCAGILKAIIEKVVAERSPTPVRLADTAWVTYRLALGRLERLRRLLSAQGLSAPTLV